MSHLIVYLCSFYLCVLVYVECAASWPRLISDDSKLNVEGQVEGQRPKYRVRLRILYFSIYK